MRVSVVVVVVVIVCVCVCARARTNQLCSRVLTLILNRTGPRQFVFVWTVDSCALVGGAGDDGVSFFFIDLYAYWLREIFFVDSFTKFLRGN